MKSVKVAGRKPFSLDYFEDEKGLSIDVSGKNLSLKDLFDQIGQMHKERFRGAIVYSLPQFLDNLKKFCNSANKHFGSSKVSWAVKSAPFSKLVEFSSHLPICYEVGSCEELNLVTDLGIDGMRVCHTASGKFGWDIDAIVENDCMSVSDNLTELSLLNRRARELGKVVRVGIRINPSIEASTLGAISTGSAHCKFGIPEMSEKFLTELKKLSNLAVDTVHMHIGSQIAKPDNYSDAIGPLVDAYKLFRDSGFEITNLDIGGGFPYSYRMDDHIESEANGSEFSNYIKKDIDDYLELIKKSMVSALGPKLPTVIFEPGRLIAAGSAFALGYVLHQKTYPDGLRWIIGSVNVNDLWTKEITPSLHYGVAILGKERSRTVPTAIGSTLCFSGDILTPPGCAVNLPSDVERGDVMLFKDVGAYSRLGSGDFHNMPRLPVYLIDERCNLVCMVNI
jgi:diaminopimelate decarboxylase